MKKVMMFLCLFLAIPLLAKNVANPNENVLEESKVDYSIWAILIKVNIDMDGNINYKKFKKDRIIFEKFLRILSNTKIDNDWTDNEKMAFWINVYNAFTIKLIIDNYPVKSIKEIKKPWNKKFFKINGKELSLGDVEHEILRKEFDEPRIHFAINCASKSCPRVIQIPYEGKNLEKLLDRQTKEYINDSSLNKINKKEYQLSKLFSWFSKDFKQAEGTVEAFVSKYSKTPIKNQANKGFLNYNWDLNTKN